MSEVRAGGAGSPGKNTVFSAIASFFSSVRTTITLLFLLAAASVIGTVIPQGLSPEQLQQTGSSFYYRLVVILDLHNVYRSWWFVLLLTLLALNLLGCLLRRLPSIPAEWKGDPQKNSFSFTLTDPRAPADIRRLVTEGLAPILGGSPEVTEERQETRLVWVKHRVYLLGFPMIHVAIIVILVGGLIGAFYGVRGNIQIREGDSAGEFTVLNTGEVRSLPFSVAVDSFTLTRYPTGEPKEYRSDVRIIKDGREAAKGSILVNHPLTYEGISLYQSDYRVAGVKEVKLSLAAPEGKASELVLRPRNEADVQGTEYRIKLLSLDPGTTMRGAGVEIGVEAPGGDTKVLRIYRKDAEPVKHSGLAIRFLDYDPLYVTGLQVGYDPGSRLVWIGCLLLVAGFMLALFTNLRRLRIELDKKGGVTHVGVAGRSRRLRKEFREDVERLVRDSLKGTG